MIDHLPTASHYHAAIAMDEELAELTEHLTGSTGSPVLPVSEMTPVVQLLIRTVQLLQAQLQQQSPKRINFPPTPQPETARALLAARRKAESRGRLMVLIADAHRTWIEAHREPDTDD